MFVFFVCLLLLTATKPKREGFDLISPSSCIQQFLKPFLLFSISWLLAPWSCLGFLYHMALCQVVPSLRPQYHISNCSKHHVLPVLNRLHLHFSVAFLFLVQYCFYLQTFQNTDDLLRLSVLVLLGIFVLFWLVGWFLIDRLYMSYWWKQPHYKTLVHPWISCR